MIDMKELNSTHKVDSDFVIYDNGNPIYLYIHTTYTTSNNIYVVFKYDCDMIYSIGFIPEEATYGDYLEEGQKAYKIQSYSMKIEASMEVAARP